MDIHGYPWISMNTHWYQSSSWPQLRRGDSVGTPSTYPAWTSGEQAPPSSNQHQESRRVHTQSAANADPHDVATPTAAMAATSPPHKHPRTCVPRPPGTVRGYSAEAPHGGQGGTRMPHTTRYALVICFLLTLPSPEVPGILV